MAPSTEACSCRPSPRASVAARQSAAVFIGTVVSAQPSWSGAQPPEAEIDSAHYVITLRVAARWRGAAGATVTVRTAWARCGYALEAGQVYLVYAYAFRGQLWTSLCTRTTTLSGAGYDLGDLGRPRSGAIPPGAPRPRRWGSKR
ncbi:MAG: hypothetical protein R3A48_25490 [Polyangiales bacterium]